jgi:hypothetical protein
MISGTLIGFCIDELLGELGQEKYASQLELFRQPFRQEDLDEEECEIQKEERGIHEDGKQCQKLQITDFPEINKIVKHLSIVRCKY